MRAGIPPARSQPRQERYRWHAHPESARKWPAPLSLVRETGTARIDLARLVGPHGSLAHGYAAVNRLIRTGLVRTGPLAGRRGLALYPA